MDDYECAGYTFCSNFDSGNLAQVQLVRCTDVLASDKLVSVDINLWTRPDCAGTEYENPNRSWFYFSIQGGKPNRICKLNILNLNKQMKLFSQGMHPVVRCGEYGKWERMKESPTFVTEDPDFVLSFLHAPGENVETKYYYAFTFPFTYTECQNLLDKFDRLFKKTPDEVNDIIREVTGIDEPNEMQTDVGKDDDANGNTMVPIMPDPQSSSKTTIATNICDKANDIYYHRELLIKSVQNRRVDLITISSFHGIQYEREPRLVHLFPGTVDRCHTFKEKKVIFISSRVHPGETPASFVLNGFLKMILDRKNKYAVILRRMFVFKIIPFLNPDGVYNGCYRTDTLGQNLNRVYITPTIEKQPSIFAVRKLIRYYHDHKDIQESPISSDAQMDRGDDENDSSEFSCDAEPSTSSYSDVRHENTVNVNKLRSAKFALKLSNSNANEKLPNPPYKIATHNVACSSSSSRSKTSTDEPILRNKLIKKSLKKDAIKFAKHSTTLTDKVPKISRIPRAYLRNRSNTMPLKTNINISSDFLPKNMTTDNHNVDDQSNMFLYIDLHGHASKKGVFMYGNHLPNVAEAIECLLLPRLMSLNNQHFHFDGCVFSERNMYHRGKRDGLSKEGSGRVAIYKMTGLIKSYTLEGNYNSGKYVNLLPPRGKEMNTKKMLHSVPKYTPTIFEDVGRALGPSILDLCNANPTSRLQNSEFHSLQGLRNALRSEIDRKVSQNVMPPTRLTPTIRLRPASSSSACFYLPKSDILKENKSKTFTPKFNTNYSKIERQRLGRKTDSQPVPSKRSKVFSAKLSSKSDEEHGFKVENMLPDPPELKLTAMQHKEKINNLKVPLLLQRRNSFNGISGRIRELSVQPSTSTAVSTSSFDCDSTPHCSGPSTSRSIVSSTIKTKSGISSFRRRKSKRLIEPRATNSTKGTQNKVKNVMLQKKKNV